MDTITLEISNIKNIERGVVEIPLEKGIYGIIGTNGCGKSTLLLSLAQVISKHHLGYLRREDYKDDSYIKFTLDNATDVWTVASNGFWIVDTHPNNIQINGMYEGSLFYGTRFDDSRIVDNLYREGEIDLSNLAEADDYVKDKMSYILHGDVNHYRSLKRVKNKYIARSFGLKNTPYFYEINEKFISQYRMSSGECLLLSLLHFIYNSIVRKSLPTDKKILVSIDEIELALHPIAVSRLIDLFEDLQEGSDNLTVILTSHSPEVIRKIKPSNLHKVSNYNGYLELENPCYPSYAIRDVYRHDGYDYLLLVEDELAKGIVDKTIKKLNLGESRLIHTVPAGGWKNVLTLHNDLLINNVLGFNKQVISILDGDVKEEARKSHTDLRKMFLPIKSVEKFIYDSVILNRNPEIKKLLNDKYFTIESIDTLVSEHFNKYDSNVENPDKKFYFRLKKNLEKRNITENYFVSNLTDDLMNLIDFSSFESGLSNLLK